MSRRYFGTDGIRGTVGEHPMTVDFALQLAGTYAPREHVCQYGESDLAFISRWMEREGMYYVFEQAEDHERLIIMDSSAFQKDSPADGRG